MNTVDFQKYLKSAREWVQSTSGEVDFRPYLAQAKPAQRFDESRFVPPLEGWEKQRQDAVKFHTNSPGYREPLPSVAESIIKSGRAPTTSEKVMAGIGSVPVNFMAGIAGIPDAIGGLAQRAKEDDREQRIDLVRRREPTPAEKAAAAITGGPLGYVRGAAPGLPVGPLETSLASQPNSTTPRPPNPFEHAKTPIGNPSASKDLAADAAWSRELAATGMSDNDKRLVNTALSGADMLLDVGMSALTGVPFLANIGVKGGAAATAQALDEGYSAPRSLMAGVGSGLITAGVESLGGVGGHVASKGLRRLAQTATGQTLLSKIPQKVLRYLETASGSGVGKFLATATSESAENWTEYDLQRVYSNLLLDKDVPRDVKQQAESALAGFLFGGIFGAGRFGRQIVQDVKGSYGNVHGVDTSRAAGPRPLADHISLPDGMKPIKEAAPHKYGSAALETTPILESGDGTSAREYGHTLSQGVVEDIKIEPSSRGSAETALHSVKEDGSTKGTTPANAVRRSEIGGGVREDSLLPASSIPGFPEKSNAQSKAELQESIRKNSPLQGQAEVDNFINKSLQGGNTQKYLDFAAITNAEAQHIKAEIGLDVSGYMHSLSDNDIRHILNQHGDPASEAAKGQIAVTAEDIKKIPQIIEGYDNVGKGSVTPAGRMSIKYSKALADGNVYYVEAVSGKNKILHTKTMWKKPLRNTKAGGVDAASGLDPYNTSKTAADGISIPGFPEKSNAQSTHFNAISEAYSSLVDKFGAMHPGEKPARDVSVPKRTGEGENVRRFARTAMEAEVTPDSMLSDFEREIANKTFSYEPISDAKARTYADRQIKNKGFDGALAEWKAASDGVKPLSKEQIVLGETLYTQAANAGDVPLAMRLAADIAAEGTRSGQSVQALRLLKKMTPEGKLYYVRKSVDNMQKDLLKKYKDKAPDLQINPELAQALLDAKTPVEAEAAGDNILKDIGKQIPADWVDKWNEWRYIAMLGNPRTHIRNILGNAVFVPAWKIKNVMKAGLERAFHVENPTSALFPTKEQKSFAKEDFKEVERELRGGGKLNPSDIIRDSRTIFKTKWLEEFRKTSSALMEAEDTLFLRLSYVDNFSRYVKANGYTSEFLKSGTKEANAALEHGRAYAIEEAQKATYRDASAMAAALNNFKNRNMATGIVGGGLFPFTKTPINILKRGMEYSPAGLFKGLSYDLAKLKKGETSTSQVLNDISTGLTGTGVMAIGAWLASMGLISGGSSDDRKENGFNALQGGQNYAINIGGHSFTIEWMAPVSLPLFVGVETFNSLKDENPDLSLTRFLDNLTKVSEPMFNLSMLQGINDLFKTVGNSKSPATDALANMLVGYLNQAVPTVLGQAARSIDGTRRDTYYYDKTSLLPKAAQTMLKRNMAKLPGLSLLLEPKIDPWGREQVEENGTLRVFENFLSPGYISRNKPTELDKELERLYHQTGDASVLPAYAPKSFQINGETRNLSAKEFTKFSKTRGQTAYQVANAVRTSKTYQGMTDEKRAEAISEAYEYANAFAKHEIDPRYELKDWCEKALEAEKRGIGIADFISQRVQMKDFEKDEQKRQHILNLSDLSAREKSVLDDSLVGELKRERDYSSQDAFKLSALDDGPQKLYSYPSVQKAVGSVDNYIKVRKILGGVKGDKDEYGNTIGGSTKPKQIAEIARQLGVSGEKATSIYNEIKVFNHSMDELDSGARAKADEMKERGLSEQRFLEVYNQMKLVTSDVDARGKTIAGSLKQNRYNRLRGLGMNDSAAKYFMRVMYNYA